MLARRITFAAYMFDAGFPARMSVVFQVLVREGDKPPDESEDDPAERKSHREDEQVPSPFDVDHRGEDVGQEATASFVNVDSRNVTLSVLTDETTLRHPGN